jgi:hypothetical protein
MSQIVILEKRTYDGWPYDVVCTELLIPSTTIAQVNQVLCDPPSAGLVFGSPVVNVATNNYPDGTVAPPGTAIQVHISGGVLPPLLTALMVTIRAQFTDSLGNQAEATALLNLTNDVQAV